MNSNPNYRPPMGDNDRVILENRCFDYENSKVNMTISIGNIYHISEYESIRRAVAAKIRKINEHRDNDRVTYRTVLKYIKHEEPKYYSGKVVCIDARTDEFTKGKIYEVKNGRMKTDLSHIVEPGDLSPYTSFENLTLKLASKFIELVENESEVEV